MNILSWNLSWESMSDESKLNTIQKNIRYMIREYNISICCFQEAYNWKKLLVIFKGWGRIVCKSGLEEIVTFWKKDIGVEKLMEKDNDPMLWRYGEFENGRPYACIIFPKLMICNVHL